MCVKSINTRLNLFLFGVLHALFLCGISQRQSVYGVYTMCWWVAGRNVIYLFETTWYQFIDPEEWKDWLICWIRTMGFTRQSANGLRCHLAIRYVQNITN